MYRSINQAMNKLPKNPLPICLREFRPAVGGTTCSRNKPLTAYWHKEPPADLTGSYRNFEI